MQLVHFDAPPPPEEDQYYEMSEGEQQSKEALQNVNFYWKKHFLELYILYEFCPSRNSSLKPTKQQIPTTQMNSTELSFCPGRLLLMPTKLKK
jgi:hypothetical protein